MKFKNANELIKWFQLEHPLYASAMMASNHHYDEKNLNPYHLENDVWTHTNMVMKVAELLFKDNDIVLASSLLHDLGKPFAREVKEDNKRVRFFGHEGLSFYMAVDLVKELFPNDEEAQKTVLKLVALHSEIYSGITDGKLNKNYADKWKGDGKFFTLLQGMVISDSMGRWCEDKADPREQFNDLFDVDFYSEIPERKDYIGEPTLTVLIGPPRAGKSTYMHDSGIHMRGDVVISRDATLFEYAKEKYNSTTYDEAWKVLDANNEQKNIDKLINKKFDDAKREGKNITIDMTNMSRKTRRKWVNTVPKEYFKKAVVFATDYTVLNERNSVDSKSIGKTIPSFVIKNMCKSFTFPTYEEFDEIETIVG